MNRTLLILLAALLLVAVHVHSAAVTCIEGAKVHEDGETWESGGFKKKCTVYTEGQGLIEIIGAADSGGYNAAEFKKGGPRLAIYDGKTFANLNGNLE
ncbi:hypothetical protein M3Y99_01032700 [Aphelenchoides fujianensis]|nr:hypothetical protein M3Y99_01032700 [Aphelenchoides fujianensis]